MIRAVRVLAFCGLLIAVRPASANAEWQFAPFVGFTFGGDTNLIFTQVVDRHWNFGGTVRLVGAGPIGLESVFVYVPGIFETPDPDPLSDIPPSNAITKSHSYALMGNVVLTTPRAWNQYGLRPYVSGGLGICACRITSHFPARANLPAYNVGGGAVGFLTNKVGLRFDLRYFRTLPPGEESGDTDRTEYLDRVHVHYWTVTVGVVFRVTDRGVRSSFLHGCPLSEAYRSQTCKKQDLTPLRARA